MLKRKHASVLAEVPDEERGGEARRNAVLYSLVARAGFAVACQDPTLWSVILLPHYCSSRKAFTSSVLPRNRENVEFACAVPNVLLSPATVKVQPPAMTSTALIAGITSFGGRNGPKDWI